MRQRLWLVPATLLLVVGLGAAPGSAATVRSVTVASQRVRVAPVAVGDPGVILTPGRNLPDPYVIRKGRSFYLFSSGETLSGPNVPVIASSSLTTWGPRVLDAMPRLPSWATKGFTWSPDVRERDGRWVMWFNAEVAGLGADQTKCIGVATSSSVMGPYVSTSRTPAVCQLDHLGSIDPRTFLAPNGQLWLLWKSDDNADPTPSSRTTIWVQRLSADGLRLLGRPVALLSADLPWENHIVEAPDMVYAGGHYWLFFSGNWFNEPAYGIGVAQCAGPVGPCVPSTQGPWMASDAQGSGPGEASLFFDGSRWWMFYAPYSVDFDDPYLPRPLALARIVFDAQGPTVVPPGTAAWSGSGAPIRFLHHGQPTQGAPCLGWPAAVGCITR
jgi:beta-xylosidase